MTRHLALTLLLCASLAPACAVGEPIDSSSSAIINGRTTTDFPWTVAVLNIGPMGGLCSGTMISQYAVLTAKHCVYQEVSSGRWEAIPDRNLIVAVGRNVLARDGIDQTSEIVEVRTTPGVYTDRDLENGADIAVILLPAPFEGIAPRTHARTNPAVGSPATIIGFGRSNPSTDESGVKMVGDTGIAEVGSRLIRAAGGSWTCQGDSGGPLLVGDVVHGVTSFGIGGCGSRSLHYFTNVAGHTAMLDAAATWEPPCEPSTERCDGVDNDCNGLIDEGCSSLGDACSSATECADERCEDFGAGLVCVRDCDPRTPIPRCPLGYHCRENGCGVGACLVGSEGPKLDGEECAAESECASRRCVDIGGTLRCSRQCDPSAGNCGTGNLCEAMGECGNCIPAELSTAPRPFGAVCDDDDQCASGDCTDGEGAASAICTRACDASTACPASFHCRANRCVPGDLGETGSICMTGEDCEMDLACVDLEGESFCAPTCGDGCLPGFECAMTDAGERCVPGGIALGEECMSSAECRSGICAVFCTRICDDEACPEGFDCVPAGEVSGCFRAAEESGGGCAVTAASPDSSNRSAPVLAGLLLLTAVGIRVGRRR